MDSFYGGLQGASFIITKRFDAISVASSKHAYKRKYFQCTSEGKLLYPFVERDTTNWNDLDKYWKRCDLNGESVEVFYTDSSSIGNEYVPKILAEGMVECFSQGAATNNIVGYGQYVLIDTVTDLDMPNDPANGMIFRRGFNYQDEALAGAEYVGKFNGAQGECPEISVGTVDDVMTFFHYYECPVGDPADYSSLLNLDYSVEYFKHYPNDDTTQIPNYYHIVTTVEGHELELLSSVGLGLPITVTESDIGKYFVENYNNQLICLVDKITVGKEGRYTIDNNSLVPGGIIDNESIFTPNELEIERINIVEPGQPIFPSWQQKGEYAIIYFDFSLIDSKTTEQKELDNTFWQVRDKGWVKLDIAVSIDLDNWQSPTTPSGDPIYNSWQDQYATKEYFGNYIQTIKTITGDPDRTFVCTLYQIIPNVEYSDDIHYAWITYRDKEGNVTGCKIGFAFPYLVNYFISESVNPYYNRNDKNDGQVHDDANDSRYTKNFKNQNLVQKMSIDNDQHPFFELYKLTIPHGIKGESISDYKVITVKYLQPKTTHSGELYSSKINLRNSYPSATLELVVGDYYTIIEDGKYTDEYYKEGINPLEYIQILIDNIPYWILKSNVSSEISDKKLTFNLKQLYDYNLKDLLDNGYDASEEEVLIKEYISLSFLQHYQDLGIIYSDKQVYTNNLLTYKLYDTSGSIPELVILKDTIPGGARADEIEIYDIDPNKKWINIGLTRYNPDGSQKNHWGSETDPNAMIYINYPSGNLIDVRKIQYDESFNNYDNVIYTDSSFTTPTTEQLSLEMQYPILEKKEEYYYIKYNNNQFGYIKPLQFNIDHLESSNKKEIVYKMTTFDRIANGDYYYADGGPYNSFTKFEFTDEGDLTLEFSGADNYFKHIRWLNKLEVFRGTDLVLTYNDNTSRVYSNALQRILETHVNDKGILLIRYNTDPVGTAYDRNGNIWTKNSGDYKWERIGKVVGNNGFGVICALNGIYELQTYTLYKEQIAVGRPDTPPSQNTPITNYYCYYETGSNTYKLFKYNPDYKLNYHWEPVDLFTDPTTATVTGNPPIMEHYIEGNGAPTIPIQEGYYYYDKTNDLFYYPLSASESTELVWTLITETVGSTELGFETRVKLQTQRIDTAVHLTRYKFMDFQEPINPDDETNIDNYIYTLYTWEKPIYCKKYTPDKNGWAYAVPDNTGKDNLYYYDFDSLKWFAIKVDSLTADISQNYYIDCTAGNDNNDGLTSGTALKTIKKALEKAKTFNITLNLLDRSAIPNASYYLESVNTSNYMVKTLIIKTWEIDSRGLWIQTNPTINIDIKRCNFESIDIIPDAVNFVIDNTYEEDGTIKWGQTHFHGVNMYSEQTHILIANEGDSLNFEDSHFYINNIEPRTTENLQNTSLVSLSEGSILSITKIKSLVEGIYYQLLNSTLISTDDTDLFDFHGYKIEHDTQSQIITHSSRSIFFEVTEDEYYIKNEQGEITGTIEDNSDIMAQYIICTEEERQQHDPKWTPTEITNP